MNQWYFDIGILFVLFLLIVEIIICTILLFVRKKRKQNIKFIVLGVGINIIFLAVTILYGISHKTYYKFNDWYILDSNIYAVKEKYGEFDLGEIKDEQGGTVAYYIYTDNGPIMPDYNKHYYNIEYDEWGMVYNVYDAYRSGD